ncbi:hypothetical protein [Stieleria mannarensis]|uniref:hypothetical protein n=1 Tax=Stieleria mannarensis TaxID=2755585 RepID=UPI0016009B09|nr:hypothetical protein [Rhodopirellula sp. JC639]
MNAKKALSIEAAAAQLEEAIAANQSEIADEVRSIREKLERLVALVGPNALGNEIQSEVSALAGLFGAPKSSKSKTGGAPKRSRVSTEDKIEFVRGQLSKNKGGVLKSDFLKAAKDEFNTNVSGNFLDAALEPFKTEGGGKGKPVNVTLK